MTLSPREALAASLSPTEILARDKEGFPQKSSITFGEVVSTFSRCGSVASKRHGGIYISKSLKILNCCSTISDITLKLEPNFRDIGDSLRFSPRSSIRTAPLARSRTPSPCSSRRPRSLPVTPRSSTAQSQRYREPRRDFHERLKDAYAPLPGGPLEMEAGTAFRPSLPEPGAATSSFNRGNPGGTASAAVTPGGGSCHGTTSGTLTGCTGAGTGGSSGRHALKASVSAGQPPLPRSCPSAPCGMPRRELDPPRDSWSMDYRVSSPKGNPRVASFVRLNNFLLRTHITSLLSALAEDGWLEAWEKERLCSAARESESPWAQSFLRIYARFMETEDVPSFVAALKAQAA